METGLPTGSIMIWNAKCDKNKKTVNFDHEKSIVVLPIPVAVLSKSIIDLKQNLSVLSKSIVVLLKSIVAPLYDDRRSVKIDRRSSSVSFRMRCERARARSCVS